jgi:ABC-2 type transport system permease protein
MFVLLPLSGVFYPTAALPTALRPLALVLPTTHAFSALRGLVDHHGLNWSQVAIAGVGSVAMMVLAAWFLVRMLTTFRQRGYISRYT